MEDSADATPSKTSNALNCLICKRVKFKTNSRLLKHLMSDHRDARINCRFCGRCFFSSDDFSLHSEKHRNASSYIFKCALCSRSFLNKTNMAEHQSKHEYISNFKDGFFIQFNKHTEKPKPKIESTASKDKLMGCLDGVLDVIQYGEPAKHLTDSAEENRKCASSLNLELELEKITAKDKTLNMLQCKQCSQLFSNHIFLARHIETHQKRDIRCKYVCKYCQQRYPKPDKLFAHFSKAHKQETPFCCEICDELFKGKLEFSKHIKANHKDEGIIKFLPNGLIVYAIKSQTVDSDKETDPDSNTEQNALKTIERRSSVIVALSDVETNENCKNTQNSAENLSDIDESIPIICTTKKNTTNKGVKANNLINKKKINVPKRKLKCNLANYKWKKEDLVPLSKIREVFKTKNSNSKLKLLKKCNVCDARLIPSSMRMHMKQHSKRFKCRLCGLSMRDEFRYHLHIKTHHIEDKFLCVCGVSSKSSKELEDHKKNYHGKESPPKNMYRAMLSKSGCQKSPSILTVTTPQNGGAIVASGKNTEEKLSFKPSSLNLDKKMNFTIKIISPQEAQKRNTFIIKPVASSLKIQKVNSTESLANYSNFKYHSIIDNSIAASDQFVNSEIAQSNSTECFDVLNSRSNSDFDSLLSSNTTSTAGFEKLLNKDVEKNNAPSFELFNDLRLVNSNPLAHLLKDDSILNDSPPKNKRMRYGNKNKKTPKIVDYVSIIKKSLYNQMVG